PEVGAARGRREGEATRRGGALGRGAESEDPGREPESREPTAVSPGDRRPLSRRGPICRIVHRGAAGRSQDGGFWGKPSRSLGTTRHLRIQRDGFPDYA